MRIVAGFAAFFVISAVPAVAQYAPLPTTTIPDSLSSACSAQLLPDKHHKGTGSTTTECKTTVAEGCPVDMRVRQRMGGATVVADANGVERRMFAQRLRLILNSLRHDDAGRNAVSAMVTVFGTGSKARMQSLAPGSAQDSMVRPFYVNLAHWDDPGVSGEFLLPGFTSASRVDLESVTYDDGTTWKVKKNEGCRVAPDPFMLINR